MQEFKFTITIAAANKADADSIIKSSITLIKKLKPRELQKLAEIVVNDPIKTAMAKRALGL